LIIILQIISNLVFIISSVVSKFQFGYEIVLTFKFKWIEVNFHCPFCQKKKKIHKLHVTTIYMNDFTIKLSYSKVVLDSPTHSKISRKLLFWFQQLPNDTGSYEFTFDGS